MAKRQPCKCCKTETNPVTTEGYGFNSLQGEARDWAKNHRFARSEYCVPVNGGKRFGGPDWVRVKCGDGRMGFTTRRRNQSEVQMERGQDGQWVKKRSTVARPKSQRASAGRMPRRIDGGKFSLVSSAEIKRVEADPIVVAQRKRELRKMKRAANRNNRARRGHKKATM